MKTQIISLLAILGFVAGVNAQNWQSLSFINGSNLVVNVLSTNTYLTTNVYTSGVTVSNSTTYPYVSTFVGVFKTNAAWNSTVSLYANRDGTVPSDANISLIAVGTDATQSTNTLKIVFYPIYSGYSATTDQNKFTWTTPPLNGTTPIVVSTNFPTAFAQGAYQIRCEIDSPSQGTTSGTNSVILALKFNGFRPVGQE